jgi:hypothetical protein
MQKLKSKVGVYRTAAGWLVHGVNVALFIKNKKNKKTKKIADRSQ